MTQSIKKLFKKVKPIGRHHLIPCTAGNAEKYWGRFGCNIDCVENIVALCPICHCRIHFGSEAERLNVIEKLYKIQKQSLESVGINISLDELKTLYSNDC